MSIITAKEAREKSDSYISHSIQPTVEYVMKEIEDSCSYGNNSVTFYDSTPICYFDNMKSNEFIEFMEKLGYKYSHHLIEYYGERSDEITISW